MLEEGAVVDEQDAKPRELRRDRPLQEFSLMAGSLGFGRQYCIPKGKASAGKSPMSGGEMEARGLCGPAR